MSNPGLDHPARRHLLLFTGRPQAQASVPPPAEEKARDALARGLREQGYSVSTAADIPAALAVLRGQPVDIVLCIEPPPADPASPGPPGEPAALAAMWQEVRGGATVLILGRGRDSNTAAAFLQAGAYDYLPPPHSPTDIALALAKAAMREQLRGDAAAARFLPQPAAAPQDPLPATATPDLIAVSPVTQALLAKVRRIAQHRTTVLLTGESGSGKEVLARALHQFSPRRDGPLVAVNCAALPETLLESLLFGHRKGAFTDAVRDQRGLLQEADRGTLFLDEIGELSPRLQVKLLRVLQDQIVQPLGAPVEEMVKVDVRIVAATLRDLQAEVDAGRFRQDLYYRLSVVPLHVPPLRERREDILPLAQHFLRRVATRVGRPLAGFTQAAQRLLTSADWPGNVRQLENTVERAAVLADSARTVLDVADLPVPASSTSLTQGSPPAGLALPPTLTLDDEDLSLKRAQARLEDLLIRRALVRTRGNRSAAARLLQLSHRALLYKLRDLGLADAQSAPAPAPPRDPIDGSPPRAVQKKHVPR